MNSPSGAQHHQRQEPKMLLGKRPRPPPPTKSMRRTTSMGGIVATVEPDIIDGEEPVHPQQHGIKDPPHDKAVAHPISTVTGATGFEYEERLVMSPSSSSTTTIASTNVNYPHVTPTPHFLRTCGLCKRALAPGRDIYMYRGDAAFCSLDCREKQMRQDERKDQKLKVQASNKQVRSPSPPPPSEEPTNTKSVVAAST